MPPAWPRTFSFQSPFSAALADTTMASFPFYLSLWGRRLGVVTGRRWRPLGSGRAGEDEYYLLQERRGPLLYQGSSLHETALSSPGNYTS
ncbi:uncharacterized protein J3R85_001538 [Psidium guajava]|nr:uncharacterized protein J3R85_001538 [Psidium guajava]